jgi:hypothetical protein
VRGCESHGYAAASATTMTGSPQRAFIGSLGGDPRSISAQLDMNAPGGDGQLAADNRRAANDTDVARS